MKIRAVTVFILVAAIFAPFAALAQDAVVSAEKNGFKVSVAALGDTVKVTVSAPAKGWVAVGLDPERAMKGADFLIGYVKDGVTVVRDDFGNGPFTHVSDASQGGIDSIMSFSGEERGGITTVSFVLPADSGDAKDKPWGPGKHVLILASSNSDGFTAKHNAVARLEIVIPEAKK